MGLSVLEGISLLLKENEIQIVEKIEAYLSPRCPKEYAEVKEYFSILYNLGEAVFQYPPVKADELLMREQQDEKNLIKALSDFESPSQLLHIPMRIAGVRTFLVAKYNAFSRLHRLVQDILGQEAAEFCTPLRKILFSIACTLVAETLYFSCLEDPSFPQDVRLSLARDLIGLLESGRDPPGNYHIHTLETLWRARAKTRPVYGTMAGNYEVLMLSTDMDKNWLRFMKSEDNHNEIRMALSEFVFALTYEEITQIRNFFKEHSDKSAVGEADIRSYFRRSAYGFIENADKDPRIIYRFFIERRDEANFRKRTSAAGPKKTLEEIYWKYLIASGAKPDSQPPEA